MIYANIKSRVKGVRATLFGVVARIKEVFGQWGYTAYTTRNRFPYGDLL
jgi:hypothetical protein